MAAFVYNAVVRDWKDGPSSQPGHLDRYPLTLLDWPPNDPTASSARDRRRQAGVRISIQDLLKRDPSKLRIILAPIDLLFDERLLHERFRIPIEFLSGPRNEADNSFGSYANDKTYVCWSHSLCRYVLPDRDLDHAGWLRSGVFLRWEQPKGAKPDDSKVLLMIFGASPVLQEQLMDLVLQPSWEETLIDPLNLFVPILDSIFIQITKMIRRTLDKVKAIEEDVLNTARLKTRHDIFKELKTRHDDFDFVRMHYISNDITFLKESSQATILTATRVCEHHQNLMDRFESQSTPQSAQIMRAVHELLLHKRVLLDGCMLRVSSLESRMQNMSNLAFNTVNQLDSRAVRADGRAMKAIAVLTMLFLPVTAVATILGSSYFALDTDNKTVVTADNFKVFWAICIPLTVGIFVVYGLWQWHLKSGLRLSGRDFRTLLHKEK